MVVSLPQRWYPGQSATLSADPTAETGQRPRAGTALWLTVFHCRARGPLVCALPCPCWVS